jgi:hypothetical protein
MPKKKETTPVRLRLNLQLTIMGVNNKHPLFTDLIEFAVDFKHYDDSSRVDRRALKWVIFAFIKEKKALGVKIDDLLDADLNHDLSSIKPKKGSTEGMLSKLSKRLEPGEFAFSGTPRSKARFEDALKARGSSQFSMVELSPRSAEQAPYSPASKTPFRTKEGIFYERLLSAPSLQIYQKRDSDETPYQCEFSLPDEALALLKKEKPDLFNPKPDTFSFIITKEGIRSREGVPRPVSQGAVVGMSAVEIFKRFGLITIETPWGKHFHHAHRQGWILCGAQSRDNLDPSTAGANYQTLFYIESPAKTLVIEQGVEIEVKGTVHYHETLPIPVKITYQLKWGHGREIRKSIYPLDGQGPTQGANKVARAAFWAVRTPGRPESIKEETKDDLEPPINPPKFDK